jgi:hypothetical protein
MFDLQSCKINITVGDGKTFLSTQKDKTHLDIIEPNQKS